MPILFTKEILLSLSGLAILAGILLVSLQPNTTLHATQDAQRRSDLSEIMTAVYQYAIDQNGALPSQIPLQSACGESLEDAQICRTGVDNCTGYVDLGMLTTDELYLTAMPIDPISQSQAGTGYQIVLLPSGDLSLCAPLTADGDMVVITK